MYNSKAPMSYGNNTTSTFTVQQQYDDLQQRMQQFQNPQQAQPQVKSDPYADYLVTYRSCSKLIQEQMRNDPAFQKALQDWLIIKDQALDEILVPQLLQNSTAYAKCEALYQTSLNCKQHYEELDAKNQQLVQQQLQEQQQQLQQFLNNPTLLKQRLQELESTGATEIIQQAAVQDNATKRNNNGKNQNGGTN